MSATVMKIGERVFLISWTANNLEYGRPCEAKVLITDTLSSIIDLLCRMSLSKQETAYGDNGIILRMEMNNTTKMEMNLSLIAINNGVKQLMQLQNSKWTARFPMICGCIHQTNCTVDILITFGSSSMKTESNAILSSDDLLNLWETKMLADVTFKFAKEKDIKAHSLIVASKSPLLAEIFQLNFKEKEERVVVVNDVKSSVFDKMLRFFYTGNADLDKVDIVDLLIVADNCRVHLLKEKCTFYMIENLTIDNVIHYFVVSHLHESPNLYKAALDFISKNGDTIVTKNEWVHLMNNYHELSLVAVQAMVLTKKQSCN